MYQLIRLSLDSTKSVVSSVYKVSTLILPTKLEIDSVKWLWVNKSDLYEGARGTNENLYINWHGVMLKVALPAVIGTTKIVTLTFLPLLMDDRFKNALYTKLGWLKVQDHSQIRLDDIKLNIKVSKEKDFLAILADAKSRGLITDYQYTSALKEVRTIWQKSYSMLESIWNGIKCSVHVGKSIHKFLNTGFELPTAYQSYEYTSRFIKSLPDYFRWGQKQLYTTDNTISLSPDRKMSPEQIKLFGSKEFVDILDISSRVHLTIKLQDLIDVKDSSNYSNLLDKVSSDLNKELHSKIQFDTSMFADNSAPLMSNFKDNSPSLSSLPASDNDDEKLELNEENDQKQVPETNLNDLIVNLQRIASDSKKSLDEAAESARSISVSAESIRELVKEEVKNAVQETVTNMLDDAKQSVVDRVSSFRDSLLGRGRSHSVNEIDSRQLNHVSNNELRDINPYFDRNFSTDAYIDRRISMMKENIRNSELDPETTRLSERYAEAKAKLDIDYTKDMTNNQRELYQSWQDKPLYEISKIISETNFLDLENVRKPEVLQPSLLRAQSYTPDYIHKPISTANLSNKLQVNNPVELKSAFWNKTVRFDNESNEWNLSPQEVYEKFIRDCVDYSDDTKRDDQESYDLNYGKLFWNQIRDMNFSPVRNMYKFNVPMNDVKPIKGVELNRDGNDTQNFKLIKSIFSTDESFIKLLNATKLITIKSLALNVRIGDANMYKTAMFGRNLIDNNNVTDYRQLFDPLLNNISSPVNEVLNHVKSLSSYMNDLSSLDRDNIAFPDAQEAIEKLGIDIHYLIGKAYLLNDLNNCLQLKHKYLQLISCYRDQFDVERWDDLMAEINPQSYSEDDLISLDSSLLRDFDSIAQADPETVISSDIDVMF